MCERSLAAVQISVSPSQKGQENGDKMAVPGNCPLGPLCLSGSPVGRMHASHLSSSDSLLCSGAGLRGDTCRGIWFNCQTLDSLVEMGFAQVGISQSGFDPLVA